MRMSACSMLSTGRADAILKSKDLKVSQESPGHGVSGNMPNYDAVSSWVDRVSEIWASLPCIACNLSVRLPSIHLLTGKGDVHQVFAS